VSIVRPGAMVGRGELGLVMAEEAYRTGLTDELTFAATVWALLLATLISPMMFRYLMSRSPNQGQQGARVGGDAGRIATIEVHGDNGACGDISTHGA
jgi:hypothetical protein